MSEKQVNHYIIAALKLTVMGGHTPISKKVHKNISNQINFMVEEKSRSMVEAAGMFRVGFAYLECRLMKKWLLRNSTMSMEQYLDETDPPRNRAQTTWLEFEQILRAFDSLDLNFMSQEERNALESANHFVNLKVYRGVGDVHPPDVEMSPYLGFK